MPVLLAGSAYRRLWAARTVSQCGDVAQFTALALLAFHLTGSGLGVSGVVIAEIAPVLLLAPLAGPLVDRLPRVTVMVGADLARMVLAAVLAVWHRDIALVYAVAFGLSAGSVFFNPAAGSLLPALVTDDELVAANSGIWSAAVLSQILVAPLAGLLTATAGYGWAFAANAASFAISAALLRGLSSSEARRPVTTVSIWAQDREALHLVARDRLLRALAVAQTLAALSAGATSALLVVLAARIRRPTAVFTAYGLRGVVDVALATITALPAALAALVCYGIGTSTGNIAFATVIQSHVPDRLRGRVFSAFDLIWQSMRLTSLLIGGLLADAVGIRAVYYLGGALLAAAALAGLTLLGVPGNWRPARASHSPASHDH